MYDIPVSLAGLTMISLPIVILYFIGSRYFIEGLTSGSLKG
jgi:ABC-type glycerol-3-phosphate transport system permease component